MKYRSPRSHSNPSAPDHSRGSDGSTGESPDSGADQQVLIYTPTGQDARLLAGFLRQAELTVRVCATPEELCAAVRREVGAAVVAQEGLHAGAWECLWTALAEQAPWSDLPLLVFAQPRRGSGELIHELAPLGNVTILDRPVPITTVVTTVQAALRARKRQYQVRDLLLQLEHTSQRKDEFLAMLGHELRNPLAAIRNAAEVVESLHVSDERAARQNAVVRRQAAVMARLVDDLLDVSRVTLGKVTLRRQEVDLRAVVARAAALLQEGAKRRNQRLDVVLPPYPVCVDGDPVRLEQVLVNLINNAIKYTPDGGQVWVSMVRDGDQAVTCVKDTGHGISPVMKEQVFDLFVQSERTLHRAQGGLGIGLTLVRSLVQMHGGRVSLESSGIGHGSTFCVWLPLRDVADDFGAADLERAADGTAARAGTADPDRFTVLLVEDNADARETMIMLLQLWGYAVIAAADGPEGVARAVADRPQVALIDIGLPGFDGYRVARQIRDALSDRSPYLIAMTGYGQAEDRERSEAAGFDLHIVKPVAPEELQQLLRECQK